MSSTNFHFIRSLHSKFIIYHIKQFFFQYMLYDYILYLINYIFLNVNIYKNNFIKSEIERINFQYIYTYLCMYACNFFSLF